MTSGKRHGGFTLIELVVVIVITGILATMVGSFIARPVENAVLLEKRASLTYAADTALRRIARDIRLALPNSLRLANFDGQPGNDALELVPSLDGASYRKGPGGTQTNPDDWLNFAAADASPFNVYGGGEGFSAGADLSGGERLVIYNIPDLVGGNYEPRVYSDAETGASPGVVTTPATAASPIRRITDGNEVKLQLTTPHQFLYRSPAQRIYLVHDPISYYCEGGQLRRHQDYGYFASQQDFSVAQGEVLLDRVDSCVFTYQPGTSQRAALITLDITLLDDEGQTMRLIRQVHVPNGA